MKYAMGTLVLHLVYGALIGYLNRRWIDWRSEERAGREPARASQEQTS